MFPFRGYLRHGTHPHNLSTPPTTTKTHSAQKDKIKPCIQHLRYLYTSENTEIQLTPVDKFGQDQTSLSPSHSDPSQGKMSIFDYHGTFLTVILLKLHRFSESLQKELRVYHFSFVFSAIMKLNVLFSLLN